MYEGHSSILTSRPLSLAHSEMFCEHVSNCCNTLSYHRQVSKKRTWQQLLCLGDRLSGYLHPVALAVQHA